MNEHNAVVTHSADPRRQVRIEEVSTQFFASPPRTDASQLPPELLAAHQLAAGSALPHNAVPPTPKSFAEQNPDYYSFDLPSRFAFYPFQTISARYLQGLHISKINRANSEGTIKHLVEALGATLEPSISAFDLTPADFYYFMYWHRVNSYPKNPMRITAKCQNVQHIKDVVDRKLEPRTLDVVDLLKTTTLEVKDFDGLSPEMQELRQRLDLDVERMRDTVALNDHVLNQDINDGDPEFVWAAGYAAFLAPRPGHETLAQRVALVQAMSPDTLTEIDEYIQAVSADAYGVKEFATIRCTECGASTRVQISLEASDFLPSRK